MIVQIDNRDTNSFAMVKGEIKKTKFTIQDKNGTVIDCSSATLTFNGKATMGASADISVVDAEMDKTSATAGIIYVPIDTTTLNHTTTYFCELKIEFSASSVDHSGPILMTINQAIVE